MLKKLIFIAFMAFFAIQCNAQKISYGLKAGPNISNVVGESPYDFNSRTSFHAGVIADLSLSGKFGLQPELLFSSQGAKNGPNPWYDINGYENVRSELELNYLSIPVMGEYLFLPGLSIQLGPQISYLLNSEIEFEGEDAGTNPIENNDLKDHTKYFQFSIGGGLEYTFDMGLFIDGRYNLALNDIFKESNNYTFYGNNRNSLLQISAGYKF